MIQPERIKQLNQTDHRSGDYVLYWMQASQRVACNHALELAIREANRIRKPLVVCFGLTDTYPKANLRHYWFMLEGLQEIDRVLPQRGIQFVAVLSSPVDLAVRLARQAALVVTDRGYLRHQREWRRQVAASVACPLVQVEADVVVPVEEAYPKEAYSAGVLRPKLWAQLPGYLEPLRQSEVVVDSLDLCLDEDKLDLDSLEEVATALHVDRTPPPVDAFHGGASEAERLLQTFLEDKLDRFAELRNDPSQDALSHMSPYLHFGQIAPLQIALAVLQQDGPGSDAYLEELIVRRELSMNHVLYNPSYDTLAGLPAWAQRTLAEHADDPREYLYGFPELDAGLTHDPYWNAAQQEMRSRGKMHGYMRMYWGKKILEWTESPEQALQFALELNDRYEVDGRDPNGYTGVAWCLGKHDRGWAERAVFGKVRYMNDRGLRRKFDVDAYVRRVAQENAGQLMEGAGR